MTGVNPSLHPRKPRAAGLLAEFPSAEALVRAAGSLRDAGYRQFDAHSPFPVHGIERAMGIRPTVLPWLVLGAGLTGCAAALLMQWWMNAIDYPVLISGKPLFSLPANIPITFELIVLFSALTAFGGTLALNRLPQFWHPVFSSTRFRRATTDGFFISVEAGDPKFKEAATRELLASLGAEAVERVLRSGDRQGVSQGALLGRGFRCGARAAAAFVDRPVAGDDVAGAADPPDPGYGFSASIPEPGGQFAF